MEQDLQSLTRKSRISYDRRKYPRDARGEKNEWKALVNHYSEVGDYSNMREKDYKHIKDLKQSETLENQIIQRFEKEEKDKKVNAEIEKDILMRDLIAERKMRLEEEQRKREARDKFRRENDYLRGIKQGLRQKEKLDDMMVDHDIIKKDLNSEDLNYARSQKRMKDRRKIFLENQILQEKKSLYSKSPSVMSKAVSSFSIPKSIVYKSEGDIFDSLFDRPHHRRKYYNMLNSDQRGKIGEHTNTALKSKVGKEVEKESLVQAGIMSKNREEELKLLIKERERRNKMENYKSAVKNDYQALQQQAKFQSQDHLNYLNSMANLREAERNELALQERQRQLMKKLEKDNYKEILEKQMDIKNFDGHRKQLMSRFEKKVNYEDLQSWKAKDRDYYTHCVPGIHPTIDKNVAKRVLKMFGKDAKAIDVPNRVINKNIQPHQRNYIKRY